MDLTSIGCSTAEVGAAAHRLCPGEYHRDRKTRLGRVGG